MLHTKVDCLVLMHPGEAQHKTTQKHHPEHRPEL